MKIVSGPPNPTGPIFGNYINRPGTRYVATLPKKVTKVFGMKQFNESILISTSNGVYRFKDDTLKKIKFKDPQKILHKILIDG